MKRGLVLGTILLASCTVAFAATPASERVAATAEAPALCGDATPAETYGTDAAASPDPADKLITIKPPTAAETRNHCSPEPNTCSCGIPVFELGNPVCNPGVDLGVQKCHAFHCPDGQTVHYRTCPCEETGCHDTWTAWFCV